jgi:hypothetical protein
MFLSFKIRGGSAIKALVAAVAIAGCGIAAFLSSIHGPANLYVVIRLAFPMMILADLVPPLDSYWLYLTCGVVSFVLWTVVLYVLIELIRMPARGEP